jgi:hypothetical protein
LEVCSIYCHSRQKASFPWLKSAVVLLLIVSTASADTGSPTTEAPADTESQLRLIDELAATLDDVVQRLTALGLNDDSELSTELTDDATTSEGSLEPPSLETEMRDDQSLNEERTLQSSKPLTLPVLSGLEDDRDQAVTARAKAVLKERFETLQEEMTDAGVVEKPRPVVRYVDDSSGYSSGDDSSRCQEQYYGCTAICEGFSDHAPGLFVDSNRTNCIQECMYQQTLCYRR